MKKNFEHFVVLSGGTGAEREVSLKSGSAVAKTLSKQYPVKRVVLDSESIPEGIDSNRHIVFPVLHGAFGEDGRLQALLEGEGIEFVGSGSEASALCMNKLSSKLKAKKLGIPVAESLSINASSIPFADSIIKELGNDIVIKPTCSGSSDGLSYTSNRSSLGLALSKIDAGDWLLERRINGREFTVGLLDGSALEIVEIKCRGGQFDYHAKYESKQTIYESPAVIDMNLEQKIKELAETIYQAFDCRDFARIDFMVEDSTPYFLEVNTIPGMTETSLLPKSAAANGLLFDELCQKMASFSMVRFLEPSI